MKKITFLLSTSLLLASLISCTKETVRQAGNIVVDPPPPPPQAEVKIASSWFSVRLDSMADRSGVYLMGRHDFETNERYDKALHIELAYVNITGQRIPVYRLLPQRLLFPQNTTDKWYSIASSMDPSGFVLKISNVYDPNAYPPAANFADFKYRYVIIPRSLYNSLSIDWNDYSVVAQALNI